MQHTQAAKAYQFVLGQLRGKLFSLCHATGTSVCLFFNQFISYQIKWCLFQLFRKHKTTSLKARKNKEVINQVEGALKGVEEQGSFYPKLWNLLCIGVCVESSLYAFLQMLKIYPFTLAFDT